MAPNLKDKSTELRKFRPIAEFPIKADYATGELLNREKMVALINWATMIGLDAWLGHVCYYYGKPYVQLAGRLYHGHKRRTFQGYETRLGTEEERKGHQLEEGDHLWYALVHDSRFLKPITEFGIVRRSEIGAMSERHPDRLRSPVVANNPSHMAAKRALAKALERAYPLGLEVLEDAVLEEEVKVVEEPKEPKEAGDGQQGFLETGEGGGGGLR